MAMSEPNLIPTPKKKTCAFQGGVGLPEKFHPPRPCLGEFEPKVNNQKFCEVCQLYAYAAKDHADHQANRKKLAKRNLENRHKRAKAAGRPCLRLGVMVRCQYRDEHGERPKGCLQKFKRKNGRHIHCEVCQQLALVRNNKNFAETHKAEISAAASLRWNAMKTAAAEVENLRIEYEKAKTTLEQMKAAQLDSPGTRGRPISKETFRKVDLMGKLKAQGKSLRAMKFDIYPEHKNTPDAAYDNVRRLASDYREEFEAATLRYQSAV
jgi:hypothetical protein